MFAGIELNKFLFLYKIVTSLLSTLLSINIRIQNAWNFSHIDWNKEIGKIEQISVFSRGQDPFLWSYGCGDCARRCYEN